MHINSNENSIISEDEERLLAIFLYKNFKKYSNNGEWLRFSVDFKISGKNLSIANLSLIDQTGDL